MPPPAPRPGKRSRAARRYLKSPPSSPATCGVVASAFLLLPVVLRSRAVRRLGGRSWAELGGALIASDARAVITLDRRGRRARRGRAGTGRRRRRAGNRIARSRLARHRARGAGGPRRGPGHRSTRIRRNRRGLPGLTVALLPVPLVVVPVNVAIPV